jgi:hypothetical protein
MTELTNHSRRSGPQRHVVQCYGSDAEQLFQNVGRYFAEGFAVGDGALLIATPAHNEAFIAAMAREGIDTGAAMREGRLVVRDAQETLDQLLVDSQPDGDHFDIVVGGLIRTMRKDSEHRGLRVYGEMVGVLWKGWQFAAALRLEEYWNKLLTQEDVSLYCAYPIDIFGLEFDPKVVHQVLCAHTDLVPSAGNLSVALERAMEDVLGPRVDGQWPRIKAHDEWGTLPSAEATVLWLRANLPYGADRILRRAQEHLRAGAA